jgi:ribosomal protein S12 methylthiotransferase accessory factor
VPHETLVHAPARELPDAVAPERFALFSDAQLDGAGFPFRRFTADTPVAWVEGRELPSGRRAFLPAELVYLGTVNRGRARPIAYATSSGLACAERGEEAAVGALCEVLERDAFMLVWANRLSLPLLDGHEIDPAEHQRLAAAGLAFAAVDLSAIHRFPIVLGVVRAPSGFPGAVGVGAAAARTLARAWWKALAEAFACRAAGAKLALLGAGATGDAPVRSFEDHIRRYAEHEHAPATAFLDASARVTPAAAVPALEGASAADRLVALCRRVDEARSTAYAVDVTSPDVAALGLTVTRVVAPELCRLDVPHDARFLGGRRLYEAAAGLGLRSGVLAGADVNPDPHPFP